MTIKLTTGMINSLHPQLRTLSPGRISKDKWINLVFRSKELEENETLPEGVRR